MLHQTFVGPSWGRRLCEGRLRETFVGDEMCTKWRDLRGSMKRASNPLLKPPSKAAPLEALPLEPPLTCEAPLPSSLQRTLRSPLPFPLLPWKPLLLRSHLPSKPLPSKPQRPLGFHKTTTEPRRAFRELMARTSGNTSTRTAPERKKR